MLLDQYIVCESQGTNEDLGTFLHAILYMVLLKICYRYRELSFITKQLFINSPPVNQKAETFLVTVITNWFCTA